MTALTEIKGTGAPLHRALAEQGITELEQLAGADFQELLALHGVGLKGLNRLNDALGERGLEPMSGVVAPKPTSRTTKADVKTKPTGQSAVEWIESLPWPRRVEQGRELLGIFREVTGAEPVMWGESIVGYGHHHYRYETGREGSAARVGFSPRKAAISLYGLQGGDGARGTSRSPRPAPPRGGVRLRDHAGRRGPGRAARADRPRLGVHPGLLTCLP